ncbi:MAG: DsbA family protein [Mycobacteriales bacterium]
MFNDDVHIELLSVPDCPNIALARERVRAALDEAGAFATLHERVIGTDEEAARHGMRGSPTILINGIDPFAQPTMPHSVSCRLYTVDGGVQGSPSIGQLVRAMGASGGGAGSVDAATDPHPVAVRINHGELA